MAQPLAGRRHLAIGYNPGTSSNRRSQTSSTHPQPNPRPHSGVGQPPLRIVNSVAPTRICDRRAIHDCQPAYYQFEDMGRAWGTSCANCVEQWAEAIHAFLCMNRCEGRRL